MCLLRLPEVWYLPEYHVYKCTELVIKYKKSTADVKAALKKKMCRDELRKGI